MRHAGNSPEGSGSHGGTQLGAQHQDPREQAPLHLRINLQVLIHRLDPAATPAFTGCTSCRDALSYSFIKFRARDGVLQELGYSLTVLNVLVPTPSWNNTRWPFRHMIAAADVQILHRVQN